MAAKFVIYPDGYGTSKTIEVGSLDNIDIPDGACIASTPEYEETLRKKLEKMRERWKTWSWHVGQ